MPSLFERILTRFGGLALKPQTKKDTIMSNYTETMIKAIRNAAPLDIEKAKELAAEFGGVVTHRSVISKAKHLGVEYVKAQRAPASRDSGPTKAALLVIIRELVELPEREGDLTKAELASILDRLS